MAFVPRGTWPRRLSADRVSGLRAWFAALAAAALLLMGPAALMAADLYVAPNGSDANPGTKEKPFATVQKARDAARVLKAEGAVTVNLRGGTYALREPLRFGPEDGGTAEAPITYRSYPGERAVLSGGKRIAGTWKQAPGKPYWQITLPEAANGKWLFSSLTVNGMSAERARTPNWGEKVLRAEGRAPGEDERQAFTYFPGDINPAWTDLTNIDIVLLCSWTPTIHKIQEVVPDRRVVRFHSSHGRAVDAWEKNFRYYLANVFEALDAPGEWYLDRRSGVLYYYPRPGERMATAEVVAPVLKSRILEFTGDVAGERFVEHLRFVDLDIRHVDGDLARYNGMYRQGHMFLDAAVYAEGLRSSLFQGCELAQLGEYAMELGPGCRNNRVERCHVWDIGAGAMLIGVTDLGTLLAGSQRVLSTDRVLEAEDAQVVAPMVVEADDAASKGRYVVLPAGQQGGEARFTVDLDAAGKYQLLAAVQAPSGTSDSLFVQVNDGEATTWDTGTSAKWFLAAVRAKEQGNNPMVLDLKQGRNTLVFKGREPGTKLDRVVLRPRRDGDTGEPDRAPVEVLDTVIDNNYIHRLGTLWHGCYGIVNRFASRTKITHNEITDVHWDAIGLDARWSYAGEKYSHGNEVAYNHLHHLGLGYHTDAGGVYQFGPLDTHIHHNLIHDTRAYPYICGYAGIYLDEQSRGALVENNLVYNVAWFAYFQHWGSENVFRNNIGAFARDGLFLRGGLTQQRRVNHCEFYRNLYVTKDEMAARNTWEPGERPAVVRDNMYYRVGPDAKLSFGGKSLEEWQKGGLDAGSVVGDPGFRDPEKLDFALRPDAPAVKQLGFVPFDGEIRKAGRYGDAAWLGLAAQYPGRTVNPVWTPEELLRLKSFSLDFEDLPDGTDLSQLKLAKEGDATFAVTSEVACGGRKSLKCVDRKGLAKPFYPYAHLALPGGLKKGKVAFSFDVMNSKEAPCRFYVEGRSWGGPYQVGPSLDFGRDGTLKANGREILTLAPGTWCHVEVSFEIGAAGGGEYTLLTRYAGEEKRQKVPFTHPDMGDFGWFGISASEDADGVFYLDNLTFRVE